MTLNKPVLTWQLSLMLCLALMTLRSARAIDQAMCERCTERFTPECHACMRGVQKRSKPSYDDFGAFVKKWIAASNDAPSCSLIDIYNAIPPKCYAKLDRLVSQSDNFP